MGYLLFQKRYHAINLNLITILQQTFQTKYTTHILSSDFSIPNARAAAVGSLITRRTFNPAIFPASFVALMKTEIVSSKRILWRKISAALSVSVNIPIPVFCIILKTTSLSQFLQSHNYARLLMYIITT